MNIHIALVFVALTKGLGYVRAGLLGLTRISVNHPLRTPSTEGRSVCLCWAPSKPKGPKGPRGSCLRSGEVFAYVGSIQNLKDLQVTSVGTRSSAHPGVQSKDTPTFAAALPCSLKLQYLQ